MCRNGVPVRRYGLLLHCARHCTDMPGSPPLINAAVSMLQRRPAAGLLFALLFLAACQESPPHPVPADAAAHSGDAFQQQTMETLTATAHRLDQVMQQIEGMDPDTLDARVEDVKTRRDSLQRDLQQLQRKSRDAPDEVKATIRQRLIALHQDVEMLQLRAVGSHAEFAARIKTRLKDLGQSLQKTYQRLGYVDVDTRMSYRQTLSRLQIRYSELERQAQSLSSARPDDTRILHTDVANRLATLSADIQSAALAVEEAANRQRATES